MGLNEDLTEAIALGHDLGHTPFGHTGEDVMNRILEGGFEHNLQSLRVVEVLENNGMGLNLTTEVLDGIKNHRTSGQASTLEGEAVKISDKIAYINHDIDDAIRAKEIKFQDLPEKPMKMFGSTSAARINFLIKNTVLNSLGKGHITMDDEVLETMYDLRDFLFRNVYTSQLQLKERNKIENILFALFNYYNENENKLPKELYKMYLNGERKDRVIVDNIAGMTDRFALKLFNNLFMPTISI